MLFRSARSGAPPRAGFQLLAAGASPRMSPARARSQAHLLVFDHDAAGLLAVAAAADVEMDVRLRHAEVGEERVRHVGVAVLAGMDDSRRAPGFGRERVVMRAPDHAARHSGKSSAELRSNGGRELAKVVHSFMRDCEHDIPVDRLDRKSTRLNSSH